MVFHRNYIVIFLIFFVFSLSQSAPAAKKDSKSISESIECADDIERLCSDVSRKDDIALLNCLQDNEVTMKSVTVKCQHFLWGYKRMLTRSDHVDKIARELCSDDLKVLSECASADIGHRVPCLLDYKLKVKDSKCKMFLNEIGVAIFSDYHLIYKFVERCRPDVKRFQCGRLAKPKSTSPDDTIKEEIPETPPEDLSDYVTSQATTFECLANHSKDPQMSKECHLELVRLAELQADDYHLNRPLYLACREDREHFCAQVKSGEGRVYDCLMKNKFSEEMSPKCKQQLVKKQEVESEDIKADYTFFKHCEADLQKHHCLPVTTNADSKSSYLTLSKSLLCLETAASSSKDAVSPQCITEINQKRVEIMEDYKVTPEIVVNCYDDARQYCSKEIKEGKSGAVVNCLMKYGEPDEDNPHGKLKKQCTEALVHLLEIAKPTENLAKYDANLMVSCGDFSSRYCKDSKNMDETFDCLVTNIDNDEMPQECQEKVQAMLYFISLDIGIDNKLMRDCKKDATELCGYKVGQVGTENTMVIQCLVNQYREDKIQFILAKKRGNLDTLNPKMTKTCAIRMKTIILAQASKVELNPSVFENCIEDLSQFCHSGKLKNRIQCLQDHMKDLRPRCKKVVVEFSELQDTDMSFNSLLDKACRPVAQELCDKVDEDQVVSCLIRNLDNPRMTKACKQGVRHWQMIGLEEYEISTDFAGFCKSDIEKHCSHLTSSGKTTKSAVVECLSVVVLKGYLDKNENPLSDECKQNFNFQLLQRGQSVKLDPELEMACGVDITNFCAKESDEDVQTCLREHQDELSKKCHRFMFRRERFEAQNAHLDGQLVRECSSMIKQFCDHEKGPRIFQCLHRNMNELDFDQECKKVVFVRLKRRMNDVRLNPLLIADCGDEIKQHCHPKNLMKLDEDLNDPAIELEGKIITCLKHVYINKTRMGDKCKLRLTQIIYEANVYLSLDPVLKKSCKADIETLCSKELRNGFEADYGTVQTCLKHQFLKKKLTSEMCEHEVIRILMESRADVHTDSRLFQVCESSILQLCRGVDFGNGQKITCLMNYLKDEVDTGDDKAASSSSKIDEKCREVLQDRQRMWQMADTSNMYPESLSQVFSIVQKSRSRNYLILMFASFIALVVMVGICCGRVTKRVPVDVKNK